MNDEIVDLLAIEPFEDTDVELEQPIQTVTAPAKVKKSKGTDADVPDIPNEKTRIWVMTLPSDERKRIFRDIKLNYRVTYDDLNLKILTPRHSLRGDNVVYDEPLHWATANDRIKDMILAAYHEGKLHKIDKIYKELF